MEFRILGPLEVRDNGDLIPLGGPKQRALLAVLLLNGNRAVALDRLVDALWGERPPPTASTTVQVYVSQLRRLLGRSRIVTHPSGYLLELGADELDVARFDRLVRRARLAADPGERAALLRQALGLWRGEALADFAYEPFASAEVDRLEEERLSALEDRVDAELALGASAELVAELERLVAEHALRERLRGQLMLALYRCGRQADALALYQETRELLLGELGLEPSPALQRLQRQILNQDEALDVAPQGVRGAPRERGGAAEPRVERKLVTVLAAELVPDPARRAGERDPEDVRAILRRFRAPVRAEIERFGGTVEKLVGSAVTAVFGAPVAHEDDAERAVRAAFAVLEAVASVRAEDPEHALGVRVGIDTGDAIVELDADVAAGEGIVVGEAVDEAARFQSAAPVSGILVGDATRRATAHAIEYRKGAAVPAWEAVRARLPLGERRQLRRAPLVGRDSELALLHATVERVLSERTPRLVTLVGAPGIGKTRVVAELRDACAASLTWLLGRSVSYGDGLPFYALRQIVRARLDIVDGDGAEVAAAKLDRAITPALGDEALWVGAHLRLLIGLDSEQTGDRREAFAAWRRFLEAEAEREPLALAFEDVHWADDGLLDFVEHLREWASGPMLVLCTARPELLERRPEWESLQLEPLADEASGRLLDSLLGRRALASKARAAVVRVAAGIPLYAEEYARALTARNSVEGELPLPESVLGVIAGRLDMLPALEKAVLQDAAVVGKVFWPGALAALGGIARDIVLARLDALERKQFVQGEVGGSVAGEADYAFAHVLVRDVTYEQLPRADRANRHVRAAEWLEALPQAIEDRPELVAYHWATALDLYRAIGEEPAGLAGRVVEALRRAGERAQRLYANAEAIDYFRRALALLEPEPTTGSAAALQEALGDVLELTGQHDDALAAYGAALAIVGEAHGVVCARLHRKTGVIHQLQHRVADSAGAFAAADAALGDEPPGAVTAWWEERIEIALARLQLVYFSAPVEEFTGRVGDDRPFVEAHGTTLQRGRLFSALALAALRRERMVAAEEALAHMRAAAAAAAEAGSMGAIAFARFNLGFCLLWAGRYDDAEAEMLASLDLAERIGDITTQSRCLNYLAIVHRKRGEVEDARAFAERTLEVAHAGQMLEYVGQARATLAWAAWREGDLVRAEEHARAAWESWGGGFARYTIFAWMPLWPLIGIALRRRRLAEAIGHARILVDPTRQPLPPELEEALEEAVAAWDVRDRGAARAALARAAPIAERYAYL